MFVAKSLHHSSLHTTHLPTLTSVKRGMRKLAFGVLAATAGMVVLQLAYPRSLALPRTQIGGQQYGWQSKLQIAADITRLNGQEMTITAGDQTLKRTPQDLGITIDGLGDANRAVQYSWRERLIPFSFFLEKRDIPTYTYRIDDTKARAFANSLRPLDKPPQDARVRLEGPQVIVDPQQLGYIYEPTAILATLKQAKLDRSMSLTLRPVEIQPNIPDQTAKEAASALQQRLQKPLTVEAADKKMTADSALLASWTVITYDQGEKKFRISYDREKIKQWLGQLASQVYVAPTPRTVTLVDGVPTGDTQPADGRALNIDPTADAMITAASANQDTAQAVLRPVIAAANTIRSYTRSSRGLQALFEHWDQTNGGQWGIVLKDFSGGIVASYNGNRQFTSASVYKMYVAYVVYHKVEGGQLSSDAVSGCLETMIVRSHNGCAATLGDMIGWGANNGLLHSKGFGSTSLAQGAQLTTANDAANYLMALQNGGLLNPEHTQALLNKLSRQIYRYGIPAGSAGMRVANKLGAFGAYNHDVAIVYHPKGPYVLSVFSYGSSHASIRELARQVAAVMGQ